MGQNKSLAHFVIFLLFCFMIGCVHGKNVQPDKTANEKPQLEVTDIDTTEADDVEADTTEADDVEADATEADDVEADNAEVDVVEADNTEATAAETDDVEVDAAEADVVEADNTEADVVEADNTEADVVEVDDDDDFFDDDEEEFEIDSFENKGKVVADPLYYFNISMFHFNDKLYFWCLKPAANAYKAVTPEFFRIGVRNFFSNLSTPVRFTSCLLQGKIKGAGSEVGRLVVNTTLGFGGLVDTAKHSFKMNKADEDFGQVLGKYRIGNGFYLYLPFLGPTTLRDSIGSAGEYFLDPMLYMENQYLAAGLSGFSKINSVSFMIGNYEAVKAASLDPYTMIRDFYIVQRQKKIEE